jgi:superfamily II DNA or RNA helicase
MTAPTLRPYQLQAVEEIRQAYQQRHRSVLFVLPTGGGKTTIFSHITRETAARGNRVCILVHRAELLRQASASLEALDVPHGLIAANRSMDLSRSVQVASVQTLARRLHRIPPEFFNLLVIDEAHHSNAGTWAKVLNHCTKARVLGVTATPVRCDGRGLGEWYSAMVLGPTPAELTEQGYLAPARVLAPPIGFDTSGLRRRMGDFDMTQAGQELQAGQAMGDCLSHYRRYLDGQTAIAFCCSVAHAEAVARLFNDHGVAAASIDGTMDAATREQLLADLGAGRLKVLTSCALIGEGVDVPSVAGCILLRPTQSVSLHLQMIGRCLRPQPGKQAVILDHVGNVLRLGHHLEEREWTLAGTPKKDREAAPSVKICPACFAAMPSGKPKCPDCGHQFVAERRELEHVDGELVEVQRREELPPVGPYKVGDVVRMKSNGEENSIVEIKQCGDTPLLLFGNDNTGNHLLSGRTLGAWPEEVEFVRRPDPRQEAKREQASAQTVEDLIAIGKRRGMKNPRGWARHVMAARQAKGNWRAVA